MIKLGFFELPEKQSGAEGKCEMEILVGGVGGGMSGVLGTPFIQSISAFITLMFALVKEVPL